MKKTHTVLLITLSLCEAAFTRGVDYRPPGPFEIRPFRAEPGLRMPSVHLPLPPAEMRLAMDKSPVPPRWSGIVFGGYFGSRHSMSRGRLHYGVPPMEPFHAVLESRWLDPEGWNPVTIDWPALPVAPPEWESLRYSQYSPSQAGHIPLGICGSSLPARGDGRFSFSLDYRW
jgi:hypothetical protein